MPPTGWQDWGCWGWRGLQHGNTAPRFVNPNQLSVAPTNAAYGLAGLGLLGVETVNIRGAVGDGGFKEGMKGPLCAHQLEGCTVWPIFHQTHTYTHTHTLDPLGGHPEAQQRWVEVLGRLGIQYTILTVSPPTLNQR